MQRLSLEDNIFLWLERRQQPLHVAGLQIYSFPEDANGHFVTDLASYMRRFSAPSPPFDLRVESRWSGNFWQHDPHFDLDHHFRHVALPKPGGVKELMSFISAEHSNLLDRSRPMWESYLIEAVHGRHFALYTKIHHSLVDGVSAMRLGMRMLSDSQERRDMPPIWQLPPARHDHRAHPASAVAQVRAVAHLVGEQVDSIPAVARALVRTVQRARANPELANLYAAPQCRLNSGITGSRRFAAQSFAASRLKSIALLTGSTCNDVILAICAAALRVYLQNCNDLPAKPLVAMVPMSLRKDDSEGGNQVAVILANLATHKADPLQRLEIIRQSVNEGKERFCSMTKEQIINYTALTLAPTGLSVLTGLLPQLMAFNVVISNVPGPKDPCYWNGARLENMFPVSAIVNHMALNITIISYQDRLEFGVLGCRRTLPSMQRLLTYMEQGLEELENALGLQNRPSGNGRVADIRRRGELQIVPEQQ
ncbi:MAG: WS/DGAT/MGAT family O-acyltransferase [Pseudomonadota bacterium]